MFTRRAFLRSAAIVAPFVAFFSRRFGGFLAAAQTPAAGLPLPDESVGATLKRLFGNRALQSGAGKIKLDLPLIAEDGGNVAVTVDTEFPVAGALYLKHVYLIADKNRRPMLAKFSFTPDAGKGYISTSVRLATSTDVRAVAEMSDGAVYGVAKHVRVTISGCDLPPQG
jgi:sulfur-oxidizing protein SoxY